MDKIDELLTRGVEKIYPSKEELGFFHFENKRKANQVWEDSGEKPRN